MMRPTQQLDQILQRCLEQMDGGASIDEVVRAYPERASELIPLLEAAREARRWQVPPQSAQSREAALARARQAFAAQSDARSARSAPAQPRKRYRARHLAWRYVAAFAFIFALLGSSVAAAQDDLPGDLLYSVKLGSEEVRLGLARSPRERADLLLSFAQRRTDECLALTRAQRPIEGSLAAIENEYALAWEAISAVSPDQRAALVQRYQSDVERQQQELTTVLNTVSPPPASRMTLEQVLQALRVAQERIGTINTTPPSQGTPVPQASDTAASATPGAAQTGTATPGASQSATPGANQSATPSGSATPTPARTPLPSATRQGGTTTPTQRRTRSGTPTATPTPRRTSLATPRPPARVVTPSPSAHATSATTMDTTPPPAQTATEQASSIAPEYVAPVVTPTMLATPDASDVRGTEPSSTPDTQASATP
jgi:hypothetical protein